MTKETILKKAIKKAVKNGWKVNAKSFKVEGSAIWFEYKKIPKSKNPCDLQGNEWSPLSHLDIIFDHSFAKAFFGEEELYPYSCATWPQTNLDIWDVTLPAWKTHLQKMVLSKDPILYLKKFI